MNLRNSILLAIAILLGLGLVYGVATYAMPYRYNGSTFEPPVAAPDFELIRADGQAFRLQDQRGKATLIFFGYTHCPDVCPVTLSDFRKIKAQLGDRAAHVDFVFITTDPERDTPQRIQEYLSNFDQQFIGLSGDRSELEPVWKDYGVYAAKVESNDPENYLVDHSAMIYVIDQQGNLRLTYLFGTDSKAIAEDVSHLLREN